MNKTRKNKYLRKNRGNEDSKNKTRKVQSGGLKFKIPFSKGRAASGTGTGTAPSGKPSWFSRNKPAPATLPATPATSPPPRAPPPRPPPPPPPAPTGPSPAGTAKKTGEGKGEPGATAATGKETGEAGAKTGAAPAEEKKKRDPEGQQEGQQNMGSQERDDLRESNPIKESEKSLDSQQHVAEAATAATAAAAKAKAEQLINSTTDDETKNALMQKNAIEQSKAEEKPTPELLVVPEGIKNGILGWLSSFFDSSKNKLPKQMAQVAITEQMGDIIKDSGLRVELIRAINKRYIGRINKILENIFKRDIEKSMTGEGTPDSQNNGITPEETAEIDRLLTFIEKNNIQLEKILMAPTKLSVAALDGNLAKLEYGGYGASSSGFPAKIPRQKPAPNPKPPPAEKKKDDSPQPPPPGKGPPPPKPSTAAAAKPAAPAAAAKPAAPAAPAAAAKPPAPAAPGAPSKFSAAMKNTGTTFSRAFGRIMPGRRDQTGGQDINNNKTRKNQQYIHEIKDNRTHLFNKEMEIINSIRNFKHGHIDKDNTKKQFMKAVKRG